MTAVAPSNLTLVISASLGSDRALDVGMLNIPGKTEGQLLSKVSTQMKTQTEAGVEIGKVVAVHRPVMEPEGTVVDVVHGHAAGAASDR